MSTIQYKLVGCALGILVLGASLSGVFPMLLIANLLSDDASLSLSYIQLLQSSQWVLGVILLVTSLLLGNLASVARTFHTCLMQLPHATFIVIATALVALVTLFVQMAVFENIPHVTDATSQLFQAKIFCLGRLAVPIPACYHSFFQHNVIMSSAGLWHSKYYAGHSGWLALGEGIHSAWMMGPLSMGISVLAFYSISRRYLPVSMARYGVLLFLSSPLLILIGASFMSHSTFLMLALCGTALVLSANSRTSMMRFGCLGLGGACWSLAFLTRVQDAAPAFLLFLALLGWSSGRPALKAANLISFAVGALPALLFLLYWNRTLYGHALATGYNFSSSPSLTPIIQDSLGFTSQFTPAQALKQFFWTLLRFNKVLFGWPASFLLIPFAFMAGTQAKRSIGLVLGILLLILPYFFFAYYGFEYEARYFTGTVPMMIVLSLWGGQHLYQLLQSWKGPQVAFILIVQLVAICLLHALFYYWPFYVWPTYSQGYEQTTASLHKTVREMGLKDALVLIQDPDPAGFLYSSGFIYNDPSLQSSVIYARALSNEVACLTRHYPRRRIYQATVVAWPRVWRIEEEKSIETLENSGENRSDRGLGVGTNPCFVRFVTCRFPCGDRSEESVRLDRGSRR